MSRFATAAAQTEKARYGLFLFISMRARSARAASGGLAQCVDALVQAALVAGSRVLVDQAAGRHAVQQGHGGAVAGTGSVGIAGADRSQHALDGRAQHRATAGVVGAVIVILTGAFDGLGAIGQGEIPASRTEKRLRTMLTGTGFVNPETRAQTG